MSIGIVITVLVYLVIAALIYWALTYALNNLPLPGPVKQFGNVIIVIIFVILIVVFLLQLVHGVGEIKIQ